MHALSRTLIPNPTRIPYTYFTTILFESGATFLHVTRRIAKHEYVNFFAQFPPAHRGISIASSYGCSLCHYTVLSTELISHVSLQQGWLLWKMLQRCKTTVGSLSNLICHTSNGFKMTRRHLMCCWQWVENLGRVFPRFPISIQGTAEKKKK